MLTTRPFEPWYRSMSSTIGPQLESRVFVVLGLLDPLFAGRMRNTLPTLWKAATGLDRVERGSSRRFWEEHNALVRSIVPEKNLLEFEPGKEGGDWETLCRFLGRKVPAGEDPKKFPHTNDKDDFHKATMSMIVASMKRAAWNIASVVVPVAAGGFAIWYARSRGSL